MDAGGKIVIDHIALVTFNRERRKNNDLPFVKNVIQTNGEAGTIIYRWRFGRVRAPGAFEYPSKTKVDREIFDPENKLPDLDRKTMNGIIVSSQHLKNLNG